MSTMICRQPNGKLCRFSTVVDTVTDYNLTDDEYIEVESEIARERAREKIESGLDDYNYMIGQFLPINMSQAEFDSIRRLMGEISI